MSRRSAPWPTGQDVCRVCNHRRQRVDTRYEVPRMLRHLPPPWCRVTTETMPTLDTLWTQRLRWQQGALENLNDYGMRPSTARYWLQQWGLAYGSIALPLSLIVVVLTPMIAGQWALLPFWLVPDGCTAGLRRHQYPCLPWALGGEGRAVAPPAASTPAPLTRPDRPGRGLRGTARPCGIAIAATEPAAAHRGASRLASSDRCPSVHVKAHVGRRANGAPCRMRRAWS